jgi:sialic acid synthase SpsE
MVFIIGEIGVNHNGNMDIAKQLILEGKKAGLDAVKFQTFKTDKLVSADAKKANYQQNNNANETQHEMLKKYELFFEQFEELKNYCDYINIEFISTPFDNESVELLAKLNVKYYKVSSGDLTNYPLLRQIAMKNKTIILSTGMSDVQEIINTVNYIRNTPNFTNNIILLHCVSCYPTMLSDVNMKCINALKNIEGIQQVGFSDHTNETITGSIATSCGAEYIEKHYTLDKNMDGPDHKASLNIKELNEYVQFIRKTELMLGTKTKKCTQNEIEIKNIARRSLAFNRNMKKGEIITHDDIIGLRPYDAGLCCTKYEEIIGKTMKTNANYHCFVNENYIE